MVFFVLLLAQLEDPVVDFHLSPTACDVSPIGHCTSHSHIANQHMQHRHARLLVKASAAQEETAAFPTSPQPSEA